MKFKHNTKKVYISFLLALVFSLVNVGPLAIYATADSQPAAPVVAEELVEVEAAAPVDESVPVPETLAIAEKAPELDLASEEVPPCILMSSKSWYFDDCFLLSPETTWDNGTVQLRASLTSLRFGLVF